MPCTGAPDEICGGPSLINIYVAKDLQSLEPVRIPLVCPRLHIQGGGGKVDGFCLVVRLRASGELERADDEDVDVDDNGNHESAFDDDDDEDDDDANNDGNHESVFDDNNDDDADTANDHEAAFDDNVAPPGHVVDHECRALHVNRGDAGRL